MKEKSGIAPGTRVVHRAAPAAFAWVFAGVCWVVFFSSSVINHRIYTVHRSSNARITKTAELQRLVSTIQ
jgi:hypothetical protein